MSVCILGEANQNEIRESAQCKRNQGFSGRLGRSSVLSASLVPSDGEERKLGGGVSQMAHGLRRFGELTGSLQAKAYALATRGIHTHRCPCPVLWLAGRLFLHTEHSSWSPGTILLLVNYHRQRSARCISIVSEIMNTSSEKEELQPQKMKLKEPTESGLGYEAKMTVGSLMKWRVGSPGVEVAPEAGN